VAEALASVDATVVRGRCLSYGEGITYWPVVEILRQLDLRPSDEAAVAAIGSLLGETETETSADEIALGLPQDLGARGQAPPARGRRRRPSLGRGNVP
jgi:hypothetical protein